MNRGRWIVAGVVIVAGATLYLRFRPSAPPPPGPTLTPAATSSRAKRAAPLPLRPSELLESASSDEWLAALKRRLAGGATVDEVLADLRFLLERRPSQAIDVALALGRSPEEKYQWVSVLMAEWSAMDPKAAWNRALELDRDSVVLGEPDLRSVVFTRVAQLDPGKVVELADAAVTARTGENGAQAPVAEIAQLALRALVQAQQPDLARQTLERWVAAGNSEALGNGPFEEVALDYARRSRHDAAEWLEALPPSSGRDFALATIAADWTATAPAEAMTWATSLDSPASRADAMQRVFNRWADSDIVAAVQWLGDHEARPEADQLIANLVSDTSLSAVAPERALQWSSLIADATARQASVQHVLITWGRNDAAAAIHYAESTPLLNDVERKRTLEILQRQRTSGDE